MTKRYINVAYQDRELAKRLGARWDASVKRWYCPKDCALDKIFSWRAAQIQNIRTTGRAHTLKPAANFELPLAG